MSIDKFRFVSPGVFINEIDNSQLPRVPSPMGPVIIGTAKKGPMMRPVVVDSFQNFIEIFGEPIPGNVGGDVWRNGNFSSPSYGVYAAQAYLQNSSPITYLRLGGYQNENITSFGTESSAPGGWSAHKAYGLFIMPVSSSSGGSYVTVGTGSAVLAGVIYTTDENFTVTLQGKHLDNTNNTTANGVTGSFILAGNDAELKIVMYSSTTPSDYKTYPVNFNEDSKKYIRKVLNTNPIMTNGIFNAEPENYFLGESFASKLKDLNDGSLTNKDFAGIVLELGTSDDTKVSYKNFKFEATKAVSSWVYSQHLGKPEEFTPDATGYYPVEKLFRFESLSEGSWNTHNIKISIEDIQAPKNEFIKYGTFTVSVRKMDDNDASPIYLERFSNVTLDPASENFIAKKIGNKYSQWSYEQGRFLEYEAYDNRSKFIRVDVDDRVMNGQTEPSLLPFGFFLNDVVTSNVISGITGSTQTLTSSISQNSSIKLTSTVTASFVMPEVPVLNSTISSSAVSFNSTYWGFKTNLSTYKRANRDVGDFLRPTGKRGLTPVSTKTFVTLDDVSASVDNVSGDKYKVVSTTPATWEVGNRKDGDSLTANEYLATDGTPLILSQFNRFTLPLVGGSDGYDIYEKDPFNRRVLKDETELSSYAYNSVKVAIESVTNPDFIEGNLAAMPGIEEKNLTSLLIEKCENRGDMLAVIDLEGDYVPEEGRASNETTLADRMPSVSDVVRNLNERGLNTSYGCSFFPWVLVRDTLNRNSVWVPPSVVALGTFSSSQRKTEVWFAPAGFNRGGLSDGAAGLPVIQTSLKLTSRDRDRLYETNINPIATFPSEGIVVFGQKTLQVTPSALDRINVRRLMIYLKKEISRMATTVLFDPNVEVTWKRFLNVATPFLQSVQSRFGITEFKLVLDNTTTTPDLVDRNIVYAKVLIKPTRAIEFFAIDFVLANSGASFND